MPEPTQTDDAGGAGGINADELARIIDERVAAGVTAALKDRPAPSSAPAPANPPAGAGASAPAAGTEHLAELVDNALARAFEKRDNEDALTLLERQVAEIKALVGATPNREQRRPAWARILIGMP